MKRYAALIMTGAIIISAMTACSQTNAQIAEETGTSTTITTTQEASQVDEITDYTGANTITLTGNKAQKITAGGKYIITGSLKDASLEIDTTEKVYLQFAGVTINNSKGPAVNVINAKKVTITLKEGTNNVITDGGTDEVNAALFSNDTLVIEGSGNLNVTGNNEHAIESDDDVIINGGNITLIAENDAIHANDNITINSGTITATAKGEGIESKGDIIINDGNLTINATDDGINATTDITINGGTVYVKSTSNDAIDSNGTINIKGGTITAIGSRQPEASIDCDNNFFVITGGTLIGAAGSASSPSTTSTQNTVLLAGVNKGETITINDGTKDILTFKAEENFQTLLVSSPELKKGSTYKVAVDSQQRETLTINDIVTVQGGSAGMGGGKGNGMNKGQRPDGTVPVSPDGKAPSGERPLLPDGTAPVSPDGKAPSEAPKVNADGSAAN